MIDCQYCGREVPEGVFCANCGAHQGAVSAGAARRRLHRYVAHPGEHVFQPGIFTTIFPHLSHRKVHEFRWVFVGGVVGVFILFLAGLITSALCVATLLLPLLYLLYLYEAQVYRAEPLLATALVVLGAIGLGVGLTLLTDKLVPAKAHFAFTITGGSLAIIGVAIPLIQEAAKPIPALLLRVRPVFRDETMDGVVFGVAAGVGFGVGETFVRFSDIITGLPVRSTPGSWIFPLITTAVLLPLLQGTATGLLCGGLWRGALGRVDLLTLGAVGTALLGHAGFSVVSQVLVNHRWSQLVILAWQAAVDVVLLVAMRVLLHVALLEEAPADSKVRETYCPHCHVHVTAGSFCPACGMAMTARPLHVRAVSA